MDAEAASPPPSSPSPSPSPSPSCSSSSPSSTVAGPSRVWRLADRRSRKAGSGNIFGGVNLWQLQRLFRAAGDQDAEQRAELVWGQRDEGELAQALIGLRARSRRRGLRAEGRDALGSRWLRAFNHLRIGEGSASGQGKDPEEEAAEEEEEGDREAGQHGSPKPRTATKAKGAPTESQGPSDRPARQGPVLRRGVEGDPDRYLHRILH